jgi:hypothetical protein
MRHGTIGKRGVLALALAAAAVSAGCNEETVLASGEPEFHAAFHRTFTQRDRFGLPAVNTAFVSSGSDKDAFNVAAPADDEANFLATLVATIKARYGLTDAQATALADFVLPDVQPLGDLSGFPNGRRLHDDVIDTELGLIFGVFGPAVPGLQSDGVDGNDVPFLGAFPYLAPPHLPYGG